MTSSIDRLQRWSWHQSHDQCTVLLLVPADLAEDELSIHLDERYLIVAVRDDVPAIKGRLYGPIVTKTSTWELERAFDGQKSRKSRTASTSAGSSGSSSYAVLTDPDISSSFANSVAAQTDTENDYELTDVEPESVHASVQHSPTFSSPAESHDEDYDEAWRASAAYSVRPRQRERFAPSAASSSRPSSPPERSMASSLTSSLHSARQAKTASRLLTIHLEKKRPEIWPALIVAGIPPDVELESLASGSDVSFSSTSTATLSGVKEEHKYNMDPTSLVAVGMVALHDDIEAAFEFFCRAWLQDQNPIAAIKLTSRYVPLHTTPQRSALLASEGRYPEYVRRLGGNPGLAKLYAEAGLLYAEGLGSSLASITNTLSNNPFSLGVSRLETPPNDFDIQLSQRYLRRARVLDPTIELPAIPHKDGIKNVDLVMPPLDIEGSATLVKEKDLDGSRISERSRRVAEKSRRRGEDSWMMDDGGEWSPLYLPGLIGAGIAIGIVGLMSVSWWRNNNR